MNRKRVWLITVLTVLMLTGCTALQQEADTGINQSAVDGSAADTNETMVERAEVQKDLPVLETQKTGEGEAPAGRELTETGEEPLTEEAVLLGRLYCRLPRGFVQYENNPGIFVCRDYPKDIACISYIIADYDGQEMEASETDLLESIREDFRNDYGEEVEVEASGYETFQIGECPATKMQLSYSLFGTSYDMIQMIIFDARNKQEHIINFIQEKDGKWTIDFQKSVDSITFR